MTKLNAEVISVQKQVSIEFIKNSGGFAVKAKPKQKDPEKGWDPRANNKAKSEGVLFDVQGADDTHNLGVHLHGNLVDVDIDSDAPFLMSALERFLPSCAHVWGRPSRPRTHRVYQLRDVSEFDPTAHPFLRRLGRISEARVEVRGGSLTRGEFSLLPGSIHPSGEPYEWADLNRARSSVSVITSHTLLRAIRLAGAIAVIAPHWQEGMRNELTLTLSGFLHRVHEIGDSLGADNIFTLNYDDAFAFMEALWEIAGDDESDMVARRKTFKATWMKAEGDAAVTGATRIQEITGDENIVTKLYALLSDSPDVAKIEEFTSRFAIWQGPGVVIDMERASSSSNKTFMNRPQFLNSYGHEFVTMGDKKRLLADLFFHLRSSIRVAGVTFAPGEPRIVEDKEGPKINQWGGFDVPPAEHEVAKEQVEPFLHHCYEIVAAEDDKRYAWLMSWLAHIFQTPGDRSKTALVLVGAQGAGKSILGHGVLMPIIGIRHSIATNSVDALVRNFNVAFDNKLFIQGDEATNSRQKIVAARLNSIITDPLMMVEPKNVDPYLKPNHARFLFTSNDREDAMYLRDGMDDRRFSVYEVSGKYRNNIRHWEKYVAWLSDRDNLARIHRFLLDWPLDRTLISRPLATEAKMYMQKSSWDAFDQWLDAMLAREHPLDEKSHEHWFDAPLTENERDLNRSDWPQYVSVSALVRDFLQFARSNRLPHHSMTEAKMGQMFRERNIVLGGAKRMKVTYYDQKKGQRVVLRPRVYECPARTDIAAFLTHRYGVCSAMEDVPCTDNTEVSETRF